MQRQRCECGVVDFKRIGRITNLTLQHHIDSRKVGSLLQDVVILFQNFWDSKIQELSQRLTHVWYKAKGDSSIQVAFFQYSAVQ
ncbi:hypothetical protein CEXT_256881 [Caerostris extrusa]|uniref:Uncharacterized protein n=1 Tax=Caerostris extrusa TaxID=172846 RepID=A0AAV4XBG8_CAEEX|nr:hypothetical protein CEXT_256881 [Caerostris extrusa]